MIQVRICNWCDKDHAGRCPEVKAIEYFETGAIKRIEFITFADTVAPRHIHEHPIPTRIIEREVRDDRRIRA